MQLRWHALCLLHRLMLLRLGLLLLHEWLSTKVEHIHVLRDMCHVLLPKHVGMDVHGSLWTMKGRFSEEKAKGRPDEKHGRVVACRAGRGSRIRKLGSKRDAWGQDR